jgi:hypothetical protein
MSLQHGLLQDCVREKRAPESRRKRRQRYQPLPYKTDRYHTLVRAGNAPLATKKVLCRELRHKRSSRRQSRHEVLHSLRHKLTVDSRIHAGGEGGPGSGRGGGDQARPGTTGQRERKTAVAKLEDSNSPQQQRRAQLREEREKPAVAKLEASNCINSSSRLTKAQHRQ